MLMSVMGRRRAKCWEMVRATRQAKCEVRSPLATPSEQQLHDEVNFDEPASEVVERLVPRPSHHLYGAVLLLMMLPALSQEMLPVGKSSRHWTLTLARARAKLEMNQAWCSKGRRLMLRSAGA